VAGYTGTSRVGPVSRVGLELTGTSGPSELLPTGAVSETLAVWSAGLAGHLESRLELYDPVGIARGIPTTIAGMTLDAATKL
jgi:hypothetical protein